jgi:hypothetical protein
MARREVRVGMQELEETLQFTTFVPMSPVVDTARGCHRRFKD